MKKLVVSLALGCALGGAYAADDRIQASASSNCGTVEAVREVQIADPLRDVFEHAVNPDMAQELLIRTDDGRAIVLRRADMRRFAPGQRVRVLSGSTEVLLEHP